MNIVQALHSLRPKAKWDLRDVTANGMKGKLTWVDTELTEPTQAEIDAEIFRLQEVYDSQEYARNRKAEYDALNQFELISDDDVNGTTTHKDAIAAIKAKWPKDNSGPV